MNIQIIHQFTFVNSQRKPRSLVNKTIPNQAPELRFIINQIQNGQAVSVMDMRADVDASLDDPDLRLVSFKNNTSETLQAMLDDIDVQTRSLNELETANAVSQGGQTSAPGREPQQNESPEE